LNDVLQKAFGGSLLSKAFLFLCLIKPLMLKIGLLGVGHLGKIHLFRFFDLKFLSFSFLLGYLFSFNGIREFRGKSNSKL